MKIETILGAMQIAYDDWVWNAEYLEVEKYIRRHRQYRAFRARILRMGNDSEEAYYSGVSAGMDVREETIRQKDAEIAKWKFVASELNKGK